MISNRNKLIGILLSITLIATLGAGCAPKQNSSSQTPPVQGSQSSTPAPEPEKTLEKATLRLNYSAQGSHAAVFYGIEQGIFEKNGIDLIAGEGKGSGSTVNIIASNGDTVGFADCGTIFNLISQGAPVKVIAPVYSNLSSAVISIQENNITKPEDLIGKTIGITEGDGPHKLFGSFLKNAGLKETDVELIAMDATGKIPALLNKQVDAILGGFDNQPFQIKAKGFEPTVIRYTDYGVNVVGMALVANNEVIEKNPDLLKRFVKAYAESWAAAYQNPDAAADALIKEFPDLDRQTTMNEMTAAFECLLSTSSKGICGVDEQLYTDSIEVFKNYMELDPNAKAADLYTMEFQPEPQIEMK